MVTSSPVENVFYKIVLKGNPGDLLFDTFMGQPFVPLDNTPIPEIGELDINYKTQDNELYDFNKSDHSFTLEITELVDSLENTSISTRRGV